MLNNIITTIINYFKGYTVLMISQMPIETNIETELPEILYTYWEEIPIIQDVSVKVIAKHSKSKVQSLIIHSLSKGVEDQKSDSLKVRHAMSAIEIKSIMAETYKFEINKSNLYYHIQKLIEQGIIKVITSVQKSNIVTSYYGRTSKLVFTDMSNKKDDNNEDNSNKNEIEPTSLSYLLNSKNFINLLENFSQDESEIKEIKSLITRVNAINTHYNKEFMHWIIKNEESFRGLELNLLDFNYVYNQIKIHNNDLTTLYQKLDRVFKITTD